MEDTDEPMADARGCPVQFFYEIDFTDVAAGFVQKQLGPGMPLLLQSHGWLDGTLQNSTLEEAAAIFKPEEPSTWPSVAPLENLIFVDRYGKRVSKTSVSVSLEKVRQPSSVPPRLSLMFARWGGKKRVGESSDPEDEGDGGWGGFGCPPCDWYMAAIMEMGVMRHPVLGTAAASSESSSAFDIEVLNLFLGSNAHLAQVVQQAPTFLSEMRGARKSGFFMLWPADWQPDWVGEDFAGYVERKSLFSTMRALEAAGLRTAFPHPADLYEQITSKAWMATLSQEPRSHLPAGILVSKERIMKNPNVAAEEALLELEAIRKKSVFAGSGGPSKRNREGLKAGVVKLGWSWEAKHVWFWTGKNELANCLKHMIAQDGCLAERCIVQEWVDFDFELRFFFLPPIDWDQRAVLKPLNYEYTAWGKGDYSPGTFLKPQKDKVLTWWQNDADALAAAHAKAEEISQFLISWLLSTHPEPVPMIRLDFMLKRLGPGQAQVTFGEFCEMGACCLKWEEGPPKIWRAALDYALK